MFRNCDRSGMQAGLILMNKEKRVDTLEDFMDRVKSLPSQEPYEVRNLFVYCIVTSIASACSSFQGSAF